MIAKPLKHFIKSAAGRGLDLLLPPICPMTGEIVEKRGMIHPSYWVNLQFIRGALCDTCGIPMVDSSDNTQNDHTLLCGACIKKPHEYDAHRAGVVYDDSSKPLILRFKHSDQHHLSHCFLPWMMNASTLFPVRDFNVILPVPLHYWRLLKRGYNQSALLSKMLSQSLQVDWNGLALKRIKYTAPQGFKPFKERAKNVKNAFIVPNEYAALIRDKHILLIDDVYTTGSTVDSCAKALKQAGARRVSVLTVMRTIRQ